MEAIKITVTGTQAHLIDAPTLTAGTVGQPVEFIFDEAWEGLSKTAVFRAGGMTKDMVNIGTECTVPWEVMEKTGCCLHIGVYGTNADGTLVIPTVWAKLDPILPGADPSGDESTEPTLPVWEQINKVAVKTVNGTAPDENGNVEVGFNKYFDLTEWLHSELVCNDELGTYIGFVDNPPISGVLPPGFELPEGNESTESSMGENEAYFRKLKESCEFGIFTATVPTDKGSITSVYNGWVKDDGTCKAVSVFGISGEPADRLYRIDISFTVKTNEGSMLIKFSTMKDVLTVNGTAPDENGNVEVPTAEGAVLYNEQTLTQEQQAQARENIGAMQEGKAKKALNMQGYGIDNVSTLYFKGHGSSSESAGVNVLCGGILMDYDADMAAGAILYFGESDTEHPVVLHNIHDGIDDSDAVTVRQLNTAIGDISTALDSIIAMQEELIGV